VKVTVSGYGKLLPSQLAQRKLEWDLDREVQYDALMVFLFEELTESRAHHKFAAIAFYRI
jgi:hypothetical protein